MNADIKRVERAKVEYEKPLVRSLTAAEIIEKLGPAFAVYGDPGGGGDVGP